MPSRRTWIAGGAAVAAGALGMAGWREKKKIIDGAYDFHQMRPPDGQTAYIASMAELEKDPAAAAGSVVHIGQSTHLLSIGGLRFLTDPWFYDPAFGALSHAAGPAVAPEAIGHLDHILVTHNHPDHADPRALDRLDKRAIPVVATKELVTLCKALGFKIVLQLDPWQSFPTGKGLEIACVPGLHDVYEVGYVIKGAGRSIYFAGDTKLHPDLAAIAERHAPTAAILPVDGTTLAGSKDQWVMNPQDAVAAAQILKVKTVMPSHADTFVSDSLVRTFGLVHTIDGAKGQFASLVAKELTGVGCINPGPGERSPI